jgi:DNA-binding transcriptional ArsR family regulator
MANVQGSGLGARILLVLGERYPITVKDVALALGAREDTVRRELARLGTAGLVVQEDLDGVTYVTLTGAGITYLGLSPKDAARLRARKLPPARPRDEDDPAFL